MKGITLTGADEKTPLRELEDLAARPGVEIGLLLSCDPKGRNRYPGLPWVEDAVGRLGRRCAVHICGRQARASAIAGAFPWLRGAGRIQINGTVTEPEVAAVAEIVPEVVTQIAGRATDLERSAVPGHSFLMDRSGGRGFSPPYWWRHATEQPVGFAGGLGPDNLAAELPLIAAVATGRWWIDMEGKLRGRGDDWFSLRKAHECVDIFHAWGSATCH